jgi:hypothetical protein
VFYRSVFATGVQPTGRTNAVVCLYQRFSRNRRKAGSFQFSRNVGRSVAHRRCSAQAELQETRDGAFYANAEVTDTTPAGRAREPAVQQVAARQSGGSERRKHRQDVASQRRSQANEATSSGQPGKTIICFECRGYGHYARDCANRRQQQVARDANPNGDNSASQCRADRSTPRAKAHAVKENRKKVGLN